MPDDIAYNPIEARLSIDGTCTQLGDLGLLTPSLCNDARRLRQASNALDFSQASWRATSPWMAKTVSSRRGSPFGMRCSNRRVTMMREIATAVRSEKVDRNVSVVRVFLADKVPNAKPDNTVDVKF